MGRPGFCRRDLGAELDGARRAGRRELDDAEAVVEGEVGVEPPSETGVERLGPVGVSDRDDHCFELQVHVSETRRRPRVTSLPVGAAHQGLLANFAGQIVAPISMERTRAHGAEIVLHRRTGNGVQEVTAGHFGGEFEGTGGGSTSS